jgi:hypothetical protein
MSQERPRPAEYNLETAPGTGEGEVITVEHGHTDARFRNAPHTEYQECDTTVDRREPHTAAFIRIQGASRHSTGGPPSAIPCAGRRSRRPPRVND